MQESAIRLEELHPCTRAAILKYRETATSEPLPTETCYVIQAGENGPVKIGYAKNVRARLRDLQVANASPLTLLKALPGGKVTEGRLHAKFRHLAISGEWFSPDCLTEL